MWLITYLNRRREQKGNPRPAWEYADGLPQNAVIDDHPADWMVQENARVLAELQKWKPGQPDPIERVLLFAIAVPRSARSATRKAVHSPDRV